MDTAASEAKTCLATIECAQRALEARIAKYKAGIFDEPVEGPTLESAKHELENIFFDETPELLEPLCACDKELEGSLSCLNELDNDLEKLLEVCNREKMEAEANFIKRRGSINKGNLARGFWPMYGGVVVGIMAAYLANGFEVGIAGSIVAGVLGYLLGHQLALQLTRIYKGKPTGTDAESLAELDELRKVWEELSDKRLLLMDRQKKIDQEINDAEDLQFSIHSAIEELRG